MKKAEKIRQSGQAALVSILLILGVLLILFAAVGLLTVNILKNVNNIVTSAQSYYVAESGVEDALLRIANKMSYSNSYTLSLGLPGSTDVAVSGPTSSLVVTSSGDVDNRHRKVSVNLNAVTSTSNISFNYGIQVGYGGLYIDNATINGNVYSNGPIVGLHNDARIVGTAVSANAPASSADQANESPIPPSNSINFRNAASSQDLAQSFILGSSLPLSKIQLYIRKTGSPANATVTIRNESSGNPGSTIYASGTLNSATVTGSYDWIDVTFSSNPQLTSGVTYWLVVDNSTQSGTNYFTVGANNTYGSGQAEVGQVGGSWNATSPSGLDAYFKVFLGGTQGSITGLGSGASQQMDITVDSLSHTATNLNLTGNLYCQTGSGNNKACNTSQADPGPQAFPISDANVTQWKTEAEAGGTISGDYNVAGTVSLGPTKITGNLTFTNNATLNMTGTIWVEGTITTANGVIIKLDPGYGADGGMMLSDGYINLAPGTTFQGSGQSTSYFLLLSTNDCDGANSPSGLSCISGSAIDVWNNVGSVVVYSTRGQIHFNNNAGAKEITGYKVLVDNNATLTYEIGLASSIFSSGPGGGYTIDSWIEIE